MTAFGSTGIWVDRVVGAVMVATLAAVGYGLLVFLAQRQIVFPGAGRSSPRAVPAPPPGARQVWLDASFGRVEAWYLDAGGRPGPTVVYAHGNGELIEDWLVDMETLAGRGVNVLLVEYPGYGHSEGAPTRSTVREAFRRAFDWLVEEAEVDPNRIVAYGRSLGGGAATDLAADRPVAALILQSTFSSTAAMARAMLVPGFLVRDRFDNGRVIAGFEGPILLMHGRSDEVIPFRHAERLASLREDLEITELDCGHNDCASEWPDIVGHITAFLERGGLFDPPGQTGSDGATEMRQ